MFYGLHFYLYKEIEIVNIEPWPTQLIQKLSQGVIDMT